MKKGNFFYLILFQKYISLLLFFFVFFPRSYIYTPYFAFCLFILLKILIYYLWPHHCICFSRWALTISHQTSIVSRKYIIEDRFPESFINLFLSCIIIQFWVWRIKTVIETISFSSFSAIASFPRWNFQICQRYFIGLSLNNYLGSSEIQLPKTDNLREIIIFK